MNQPIEEKWKIEGAIVGITERIVIEYANFSGRETAHRAEFRKRVEEILTPFIENLLEQERQRMSDEIENLPTFRVPTVRDREPLVKKEKVKAIINK